MQISAQSRALPITILGLALVALPFINYILLCSYYRISFLNAVLLFRVASLPAISFLLFAPLVSIGIFLNKNWGWLALLALFLALTAYNTFTYLRSPGSYNLFTLVFAAVVLISCAVIFRKYFLSAFRSFPKWRRLRILRLG